MQRCKILIRGCPGAVDTFYIILKSSYFVIFYHITGTSDSMNVYVFSCLDQRKRFDQSQRRFLSCDDLNCLTKLLISLILITSVTKNIFCSEI